MCANNPAKNINSLFHFMPKAAYHSGRDNPNLSVASRHSIARVWRLLELKKHLLTSKKLSLLVQVYRINI